MKYISTRGRVGPIEFQDAVLMGLADDGGLVIPDSIPDVTDHLGAWRPLDYRALALEVMRRFVTDLPEGDLKGLVDKTYGPAFEPVVATVKVGPLYVLELWHGPTFAFKDIALQFLGNLFEYILAHRGGCMNILGATSGDTGSAAIHAVRGRRGIDVFMMHPHARISQIQERQMTTVLDANVHNMSVRGSFDDCQRIMKDLAGDVEFKRKRSLGAVNSINWARVLAQVVYYFRGVFDVQIQTGSPKVRVAVPTGNFGDVLAGYYAMRMGCPISQLILATNENDILARFFNTGLYAREKVLHTLSPWMDIQAASNFERYLYYKVGCDAQRLREMMEQFAKTGSLRVEPGPDGTVDEHFLAARGTEQECLETIRKYHAEYRYVLDPHTAVGVAVAERVALGGSSAGHAPDDPVLCLATAHPAKFPDAIFKATGRRDLARHPKIDALKNLPARCAVLPNDREAVRHFIERTILHPPAVDTRDQS